MKSSSLALQPIRPDALPVEDQTAPGTSTPQERPLVMSVCDTAPPPRRRRRVRAIVIRDQGLTPFRVY